MPKRKLKIGFVFDDSLDSNDGVAQYVRTLGKWLSLQGHSVRYLVGETKRSSWAGGRIYSLAKNAKVAFNQNVLSVPLPASRKRIARILADEKFDVLHIQVPHSPLLGQRVIKAANEDVAVVGTFHILPSGRLAEFGSKALSATYGKGLARFDAMASVSQPAADFARQTFGITSKIIPNVIELKAFKSAKTESSSGPRIVFLGRLVARKGAAELLAAFNILHSSNPHTRLVIAGEGPLRKKLVRFVAKQNLTSAVEFRGRIPEADKPALLASANIACFPSTGGESFGIVLLEAMAAGAKIVLGGNNPGYQSVLGEQPQLLVNPSDSVRFAQALKRLLNDEATITDLHNWQSREVRKYDVGVVGPLWVGIYNQAIAKRRMGV